MDSKQAYAGLTRSRAATKVRGRHRVAAVDQIRTVDRRCLVKKVGTLPRKASQCLLNTLAEVFAD